MKLALLILPAAWVERKTAECTVQVIVRERTRRWIPTAAEH
jgi:hypothetical protein